MATETPLPYVLVQLGGGPGQPLITIKITDLGGGNFKFDVDQTPGDGGVIGDLRGLFFDIGGGHDDDLSSPGVGKKAPPILNVGATGGDVTAFNAGNDSVTDLGNGSNMNGATSFNDTGAEGKGYDVGVGFGSAGIGKDDIRDTCFTFDGLAGMTLDDFAGMDFGVRLTSVGVEGGPREGSLKLTSSSFRPIDDDSENINCVMENDEPATGDLIDDVVPQTGGGTVSQVLTSLILKDVDGNTLDTHDFTDGNPWTLALDDLGLGTTTEGATITIFADGTYEVTSGGDPLSQDEHIAFNVEYTVHQTYYDASGDQLGELDDTSTLSFDICGANDGPVAQDDDFIAEDECILEDATKTANVLADNGNGVDDDIDRLDTISVTGIRDGDGNLVALDDELSGATDGDDTATVTLASGATVTINADGTFTYDTNGAFAALNNGDMVEDSFVYEISDNNGATDEATATVCIDGVGGGGGQEPPPDDHFHDNGHDLSYATFYFGTTSGDTRGVYDGDPSRGNNPPDGVYTVKVDAIPSGNGGDLDDYYGAMLAYIILHDPNVDGTTPVLGVAIHAGLGNPVDVELFYAIDGTPASNPYPDPPVDPAIANEVDTVISFGTMGIPLVV